MNKLKIGVDFDGVIAYNPLRVIRIFITGFKRLLGVKKTKFTIPKSPLEKAIWLIPHKLSWFPSPGIELLKNLSTNSQYEFYLISGRYHYLTGDLFKWIKRHNLKTSFVKIITNDEDEQPHLFKERVINKLQLNYFIEDNWDIIEYLSPRTKTKVLWIYNLMDRNKSYKNKYPHLERALEDIRK